MAGSFKKIGGATLVNTTTLRDQNKSAVAALDNGRFVVTWDDWSKTGADQSKSAVRGQIFAADGSKSGDEFLVNTTTINYQFDNAATALGDGRFVVTWTDVSPGGEGNYSFGAVRGQFFAADGSKSGGEFLVSTTTFSWQSQSAVTALGDGRFVATWSDLSRTGEDTSDLAVRGQIFAADGSKSGDAFLVNTTTVFDQQDSAVTALGNGRFVVTWTDSSGTGADTSGTAVRGQIFAADGSKAGVEFLVNKRTSGDQNESAVTALGDGTFVVTWTDGGAAVRGQLFSADGSKSGDPFLVTKSTAGNQSASDVAALGDGRFVVTWAGYDNALHVQVFAADGSKSGGELVVADPFGLANGVTDFYRPAVKALGAGRFVVTWTSGDDVQSQIFDSKVYTGDATAETVTGGSLNDTIYGGGGADKLSGGAGNDEIHGVGGATISGGSGTDLYAWDGAGALRADLIGHVAGNAKAQDKIFEIENVRGGAGADDIVGDSAANVLYGLAGNDTLAGRDGNDTLIGGAGNDTLIGGKGRDLLTGGDGVDTFVFAPGDGNLAAGVVDTITDFKSLTDKIDLTAISAQYGALSLASGLKAGTHAVAFDAMSKSLLIDWNGDGHADMKILLQGVTSITRADLLL